MKRVALMLVVFLAPVSMVAAQEKDDNVLTPTDILEFGQFSITGAVQVLLGRATVKDGTGTLDVDLDTREYDLYFAGGVGLGGGFEVEASIPYRIQGIGKAEEGIVEFEQETYSVGDLTLRGNYRVLKEEKESPQLVVGAIVVVPTGYWREQVAEITVGGTVLQEGEKGGIGEGIWRFGLGAALSKRFGPFEPYAGGEYLLGGDAERRDVDYERPGKGRAFAGAELHLSENATIDLRGTVDFVGKAIRTENDVDETEEQHLNYGAAATLYARLSKGLTLLLGGGVMATQDHWLNKEGEIEIEGAFGYYLAAGLHLMLGLK